MEQDLFKVLPPEIIIEILLRLPIRTITHCKCVHKSWLRLIETNEFFKSHLSKSIPGLIIEHPRFEGYKLYEFEDGDQVDHRELHSPLTKFNLPGNVSMCASADGLLFLRGYHPISLYICNPISRDYIQLDVPKEFDNISSHLVTFGFGANKITGQHKVVGIIHGDTTTYAKFECHVYTLETRSWRTTAGPLLYDNDRPTTGPLFYDNDHPGLFLSGNLHWFELESDGSPWISCFDLEKEIFTTISCVRPLLGVPLFGNYSESFLRLVALGDCLCLCDNTSDNDIVIWLMKEYGVEKSWTKEFVISKVSFYTEIKEGAFYPIKVFKDGDILMLFNDFLLLCYSKKNGTVQITNLYVEYGCFNCFLHTPSFYSLKRFCKVNVRSF